ncbi:MAG: hypothetical protein AAF431_02165 [Pseudomonadota bacterium]
MSATHTPTVNLAFALRCEAKPWIDHYNLIQKQSAKLPLFQRAADNEQPFNINLIVAGIGGTNMASGCGWLAAQSATANDVWVNIGIAGHASLPLGEAALVVHSLDSADSQNHYPPLICKWTGAKVSLLSGNEVISDYPQNQAVDMEASAFFQTARRFSSSELVQSLKVISDNQQHGVEALNAKRISELIASQVEQIDAYIRALVSLVPDLRQDMSLYPELEQFHCTVSQRQQFTDLSGKLLSLGMAESEQRALLAGATSMKQALQALRSVQLETAPALPVGRSEK